MIPSILDVAKDVDTLKKYVQYLSQQVDTLLNNSALKPGDFVRTTKGCRINGPFSGTIVSIGHKWGRYPAVKVRKQSGKIVLCLQKNIVK